MIEKNSDFLRIFRLIIGNLNINSISNKFDQLKLFLQGKVDILVTETKLDSQTFPLRSLWYMVIVNHIVLTEIEMGVEFLFIFEKTYQANY